MKGDDYLYLSFSEYQNIGGTLTESSFNIYEPRAERKLNYFTQNRLVSATIIISEVKELLTVYIDKMVTNVDTGNIRSYGNGIESFSYSDNQKALLEQELYQLAIEYLPVELISASLDDNFE